MRIFLIILLLSQSVFAQSQEDLTAQINNLTKILSEHIAKEELQRKQVQTTRPPTKEDVKKIREGYKKSCEPFKYAGFYAADNKIVLVCK